MAEVVVCSLLDQLQPIFHEEAIISDCLQEEVEQIRDKFEQMRVFLRDADAREEDDPGLRVWVDEVRDVAYDTAVVLDEFMLLMSHHHGVGFCGFLQKIVFFFKNLEACFRVPREIRRIKLRVDNISNSREKFWRLNPDSSSAVISNTWDDSRHDASQIEEAELVGIKMPKRQLLSWLFDGDSRLKVVSVVGMGGLGKTTLIKKVFAAEEVKKHFELYAWILVSQSRQIVELLKNIVEQLYDQIMQPRHTRVDMMRIDSMQSIIREIIRGRRYVVVLDDVWSIEAYDAIMCVLPDDNCGSRVLLTTRMFDVARASCLKSLGYMYEMKPLSNNESWELFCKKTFEDQHCPQHLKVFAQNILRKCEGLPLAIVAISGTLALKDKSRIDEWAMAQRNLSVALEGSYKFERMIKLLSTIYYDLPFRLKFCFLYLSMFPEHQEIEKMRVIRLWIAEGVVKERGKQTLEEVAEGYFNELFNRSLIQVAKTTLEGRPRTYSVTDLLFEVILSKMPGLGIVHVASNQDRMGPTKVRRLAIQSSMENVQESQHFDQLCSLLVYGDSYSIPNSSVRLRTLLSGVSKFLRVLDLSDAPMETFPDLVCELLLLKYLSMRNTIVEVVPKSIGNLLNLQTLDLRATNVHELPVEMGKLGKLRHLLVYPDKLEGVVFKAPANIGNLSSLQKLVTIVANQTNGESIMGEVGKLTQLRTLRITKLRREDGVVLCSSLEKLGNLRSLNVASVEGAEIIDMRSLSSGPPFLQKLYLRGRLKGVPRWIPSLHILTRVWLHGSQLMDDSLLLCLQDLPNLLELGLIDAYEGEKLCFEAGGFQRLKRLHFGRSKALRRLIVEDGAMPHLVELSIVACDKLEEEPFGIEHLTNLQSLAISGGVDSWVKILQDRDSEGGDYLKIAHIPQVTINLIR
ncbi:unnamed protein product [Ilex paraguariensis]|uniref:Disease resistance protein RPM1-like n=1 Tax=Ilex paraguariensis TaxID=185542 RepID=A0ABC8S2B1_9AQUA